MLLLLFFQIMENQNHKHIFWFASSSLKIPNRGKVQNFLREKTKLDFPKKLF